jgi:hypothetical protein
MRLDGVRFTLVDVAPARDAYRVLLGTASVGMAEFRGACRRIRLAPLSDTEP